MTDVGPGVARMRIDAHHHLWDLSVRDQPWTAELPLLRRSFSMADLLPELAAHRIHGTVLVQTVTVPEETPEMLAIAAAHEAVLGVVGWVDLTAPDVAERLQALLRTPEGAKLVGIRHQVQLEADAEWLLREDVLRGLAAVRDAGLAYDLVALNHQLPAAVKAAELVPGLRWVIDHAGKPSIAAGEVEPWRTHLSALAAHPNVACKLSGLLTEADEDWTFEQIAPYAGTVLEVFGPDRVMLGSDWPVCLLRASYSEVEDVNRRLLRGLSESELREVHGGTAQRWYFPSKG